MLEQIEQYEVIVIGAGVAGAIIAAKLAGKGVQTLLLEAGMDRAESRQEMVGKYALATNKIPSAPYTGTLSEEFAPSPKVTDKEDGHYIQSGPNQFKSTYERLGGGSTWHMLGNTPRFLERDFQLRTLYGVGKDWPVGVRYNDLEPWYCEAEKELGVSGDHEEWNGIFDTYRSAPFPMPRIWPTYGDDLVASQINDKNIDGTTIRLRVTPQARNSTAYQGRPSCAGNSSCVPICPIAAKYDATVHIRQAKEKSAKVRYQSVLRKFNISDSRIDSITYSRWTTEKNQHNTRAKAKVYVLATHAIEAPLVLLESGIGRCSPVGENLMDHLQAYVGGILPDPVYPFRGPPVTSGIDAFRDGEFRGQHAAFRISVGNDGWGRMEPLEKTVHSQIYQRGLLGKELREAVNHRVTRMLRLSFSTEMLPESRNCVTVGGHDVHGNPKPRIQFRMPDYNLKAFLRGNQVLDQLFRMLKSTETVFSFNPDQRDYAGAGHIMGTCCMGHSASDSVVNSDCAVHDHPDLFVVGAQVFPTSGTANPTLTVAALALRSVQTIINRVRGSAT